MGLADEQSGTQPSGSHRSLADGDLATAWSMEDFFGSLNGVMRLPARPRSRNNGGPRDGSQPAQVGGRPRIPPSVLIGAALLSLILFAGGPLLATWSADDAKLDRLAPAAGVWKATNGRYAGRLLSVSDSTIGFSTDASGALSAHEIKSLKSNELGDSTLFTVTYREGNGTSDFSFWLYQSSGIIRFKNAGETAWVRASGASRSGPK